MMTRMQLKQRRRRMTVLCVAGILAWVFAVCCMSAEQYKTVLSVIGGVAVWAAIAKALVWLDGGWK